MTWRPYAVIWRTNAANDLKAVPRDIAATIVQKVDNYAATGEGDVRALRGHIDWRLRVGDYRVRFVIDREIRGIVVSRVLHRREAYR